MKTRYRRSPDVLWRHADSSVVLLPLRHGELLELTGSGRALWDVLADPATVDDLVDRLCHIFGVTADALRGDVVRALESLERVAAVQAEEAS